MIKFTSNKKEVLRKLKDNKKLALEAAAVFVKSDAKNRSPVDTGNLRSSIDHRIAGEQAQVGATAEYAPYVELGTSKQRAKPYLRPAFEENPGAIQEIVEKYYKG